MTNMRKKSTMVTKTLGLLCLISASNIAVFPAFAQNHQMTAQSSAVAAGLSYADIVDLSDGAPLVANVRISNIIPLKPDQAPDVPKGHQRVYIEAEVTSLIRGDSGISPVIGYLYDAPLNAKGKLPKLKKAQVLIFARPSARAGQVQLVAPDAQIAATPAEGERVRTILTALVAPSAPPRITGLGDTFHVAGTIAGEGETQIFLRTENGDPVSLSVIRRPGQQPSWAVALGEIVDEAARAPTPGSLLWYRLTCSLPAALPAQSVRTLAVQDAEAARADYQFVLRALGPCVRNRKPR